MKPEFRDMEQRPLGNSGLIVSALGLGCMGMSAYYGKPDRHEALATIDRALELGINFFDTADMYAAGDNEELLGRALRHRRKNVSLATKFGNVFDAHGNFTRVDGSPKYLQTACEASLRRLKTDHIDLYYLHRVDQSVPIEDTIGAMAAHVRQGKIRFIGLSEAGPSTISRAHAIHPLAALQTEYSLWSRDPEKDGVLNVCHELGIGFVAYSPLGRGFLTGSIQSVNDLPRADSRLRSPRFEPVNLELNRHLLSRLSRVAERNGCTLAQLSLAWLLTRPEKVIPIPGTKRTRYVEENIGALSVKLRQDEIDEIDRIMPSGIAAGTRYSEQMMKLVERS